MNQLAGLVTPPQIARLLDVSRARTHELLARTDFPTRSAGSGALRYGAGATSSGGRCSAALRGAIAWLGSPVLALEPGPDGWFESEPRSGR